MNTLRIAAAALTLALGSTVIAPQPARADGAASTRNIIFGAAAIGGTLLILNHNKKVHEKYAEYDRRQAQTQAEANNAEAAYSSEQEAYSHQVAINGELQKEIAYQHSVVTQQQREIAALKHSVTVSQAQMRQSHPGGFAQPTTVRTADNAQPAQAQQVSVTSRPTQVVSYGWGSY